MNDTGKIPFVDLVTPHRELRSALRAVFDAALDSGSFIGGKAVEEFERNFAALCETEYCVGVSNGTDALRFALMAAGIRPGDVVITVPNTFIATTEAITQAGARPAFVDIDDQAFNMDPIALRRYLQVECVAGPNGSGRVERRSGARVAAIIPVHLYGQTADMDPILELAERYDLFVIEDACQAHGAAYFSRRHNRWCGAGSMGSAAAFSFYPGKNLGACGEGGAVTTRFECLATAVRMLRDHGQSRKYFHELEGYNGRLDAIQAGILNVKLQHLDTWNEQRRHAARVYDDLLQQATDEVVRPTIASWAKPVYHLYVVRIAERDRISQDLAAAGVHTGVHYPVPLHLSRPYKHLGFGPGSFPVAEKAASEVLSLPMFPGITVEAQRYVVEQLTRSIDAKAATARV